MNHDDCPLCKVNRTKPIDEVLKELNYILNNVDKVYLINKVREDAELMTTAYLNQIEHLKDIALGNVNHNPNA